MTGTLTPIVSNPDAAFMSDAMRGVVRAVAELFPTAIISGRGREKVEGFVQLRELYYAGSHGMDIVGPQVGGCCGRRLGCGWGCRWSAGVRALEVGGGSVCRKGWSTRSSAAGALAHVVLPGAGSELRLR